MIEVVVYCDRKGRYDAMVDGEYVALNVREPFLAAARKLIDLGYDPTEIIAMRRYDRDQIDMTATLHRAAMLTVEESETIGPRFGNYRPFSDVVANFGRLGGEG